MSSAEITAIFPGLHVLNAFSTAYHSREQGINKAIIYMQTFFEEVNMCCFFILFWHWYIISWLPLQPCYSTVQYTGLILGLRPANERRRYKK